MNTYVDRPVIVELRLGAFKSYRRTVLPLAPVTVLHGPSGAGRSNLLESLIVLSALAEGEEIGEMLDGPAAEAGLRGGAAGCVPHGSVRFTLGCTVTTPAGPVALDVAIAADRPARVVAERLYRVDSGEVLMETREEDPAHCRINAAWLGGGRQGTIRAPLPSTRLVTAQLPLRVAGATEQERQVLSAAEHVLTALREVFSIDPAPELMRIPAPARQDARLCSNAANLSAVLPRIKAECAIRAGKLVRALDPLSPDRVEDLDVIPVGDGMLAVLDEGPLGRTGFDRLSSGALRYIAFSTVLLTGPGVLEMAPAAEVPAPLRLLTVLAPDLDAGLGRAQTESLLRTAVEMTRRGHVRVLATLQDPSLTEGFGAEEVAVVGCRRDGRDGSTALEGRARSLEPVGVG